MTDTQQWVQYDFKADQGSEWKRFVRFLQSGGSPVDLTGCEIDMNIRMGVADSGADLVAQLTTRGTGSGAGRITYCGENSAGELDEEAAADPTTGRVRLFISSTDMAALRPGTAKKKWPQDATLYYDIEITDTLGVVRRWMAGEWVLSREVTRIA